MSEPAGKQELMSVAAAQAIVLRHARPLAPVALPLASALGQALAEDVSSDLDMPPYTKALMDGYAVRCADLPQGQGVVTVIEEVLAGRTPTKSLAAGQATRIMTGAPIPDGADAVIPIERTQLLEGRVRIEDRPPKPGLNILPQGQEMRRGDVVLRAGAVLRPQEVGLLATVGRTHVAVVAAPQVAILSTGDEVVEPDTVPGPGQIRNSNGPMLVAQVARSGVPRYLGIARDDLESLQSRVREGLQADVLILSGGVSAGKADLVPGVLRDAGVEAHFHKVAMKPGKPVFFGTKDATLVFGLPGNPVSAFVCFELFIRPALRRLAGHAEAGPVLLTAELQEPFAYRTDRPTYHPARLEQVGTSLRVRPVPWFGSADLRAISGADALLVIAPGEQQWSAGQVVQVLRLEA